MMLDFAASVPQDCRSGDESKRSLTRLEKVTFRGLRTLMNISLISGLALLTLGLAPLYAQSAAPVIFSGAVDGSAAVPVDATRFIAATDEDNVLRLYARTGGAPLQSFDLNSFLAVNPASPETDLEGAALIGTRAYWITAHARDKQGRVQSSRQRLFATDVITNGTRVELSPAGKPYTNLLHDLTTAEALKPFDLAGAAQRLPEAPGGLNIEGLAATPEGHLLIGFRNPVPNGRALLVPLLNPDEIMAGKPASLGKPVLLDLGGLAIRDITLWRGEYLIVAGSYDGRGASKLFRGSGGGAPPRPVPAEALKGLNPEALIICPDKGLTEVQFLSDDSSTQKDFPSGPKGPARKRFRSATLGL
jgi:hypothetical protein